MAGQALGIESLTPYESRASGVSGRPRREGSSHSHPTKAGHRAPVSGKPRRGAGPLTSYESRPSGPVSGRPRRGIRSLTCYESRPSGTRQWQVKVGEIESLTSYESKHRASVSAGQGGGISSHSRNTIAGHQALVSSRASGGDWVTHILRKQARQRQATAWDQVTHMLRE